MNQGQPERRILLTGATGYVGGRLLSALESRRERVRCLVRRPQVLAGRVAPTTEICAGDLSDAASLVEPFRDVDTAYYLVHSLGSRGDFEEEEARSARHFAEAAKSAGVRRIIYLGGLCNEDAPASAHMRSRFRVGEVLRASGIPTLEFRASVIIGSGSLSFELIRSLVQRLPIMVTPRWVSVKAQPIAIDDVASYLLASLDLPDAESRIFEIGGAECMSYLDVMRAYGRMRGLKRLYLPVPVLTPRLSSLWLHLVTPVFAPVGRRLIDSITTPSMVRHDEALTVFPVRPMGVEEAIARALKREDSQFTETHWTDALSSMETRHWGGVSFGSRLVDCRRKTTDASPEAVFAVIQRIGGKTGWYYGNWLWQARGVLDRLFGGVGMHRGRRDPNVLRMGDVLDCWRVEAVEPPNKLTLAAEMRMPGRGWLQFEVERQGVRTLVCQTALYDPVGLLGYAYWYAVWPLHQFVFEGMLTGILRKAEREAVEG